MPDASKDTTIIDVEPNSGTITHYDEGLEINVYLVLLLGPQNILPPPPRGTPHTLSLSPRHPPTTRRRLTRSTLLHPHR